MRLQVGPQKPEDRKIFTKLNNELKKAKEERKKRFSKDIKGVKEN